MRVLGGARWLLDSCGAGVGTSLRHIACACSSRGAGNWRQREGEVERERERETASDWPEWFSRSHSLHANGQISVSPRLLQFSPDKWLWGTAESVARIHRPTRACGSAIVSAVNCGIPGIIEHAHKLHLSLARLDPPGRMTRRAADEHLPRASRGHLGSH